MNISDGGEGIGAGWGLSPAFQDLAGLWLAGSSTEPWRALIRGSGLRPSANHWDAGLLFRHHHGEGQPRALDTALLLCTDNRWGGAAGRLIDDIASSGILVQDELVTLAEQFLQDAVRWELPEELTEGPWASIVLTEAEEVAGEGVPPGLEPSSPAGPMRITREIRPPLRRWGGCDDPQTGHDPARLAPHASPSAQREGRRLRHGRSNRCLQLL